MPDLIIDLKDRRLPDTIGAKARNLRQLIDRGVRVPATQVCVWDAHERYLQDDGRLVDDLQRELAQKLAPQRPYAVRSSANVEDGQTRSFAGQFKSVLNVQGADAALQAMWSIWATTQAPGVQAYLARAEPPIARLRMAVLLQDMVPPVASGVAFSKNPVTGLDEVIVEAVPGSGDRLVQDGVTPDRWVNKWGNWLARPEASPIQQAVIEHVVRETRVIARAHGRPIDLEWVFDGQDLYWVQLREITTVGSVPIYSNRIAKEMLPGLIKPLVWSVNVPLVNSAWVKILTEMIGPNTLDPLKLAKAFYYRAYFNMSALGEVFEQMGFSRESLELMMGLEPDAPERPRFKPSGRTYRLLPRMLAFTFDKLGYERQFQAALPRLEAAYRAVPVTRVAEMAAPELLAEVDRLWTVTQTTARHNILAPLMMQLFNRLLRGQLARLGVDEAQFDVTHGLAPLRAIDPNAHLADLRQLAAGLPPAARAALAESASGDLPPGAEYEPLRLGLAAFLDRFGHLSDSGNDFSVAPWRENPGLVLKLALTEAAPETAARGRVGFDQLPLPGWRRALLRPLYQRARQFRLYREQVSSLYTYGYGLFRVFFLALGDRFVDRGWLAARDDVFYLTLDELRQAGAGGLPGAALGERVAARRAEMEGARGLTPPTTLFGDTPLPLAVQPGHTLTGIAASRGYYRGPARVIRGLSEFNRLQPGDVLVIPYSDVGWTPLFARAGAVVAESGGLLSHSSIVAREYHLPAVVSATGACDLPDGALVTVDGYRGEVTLAQEEGNDA